MINTAGLNKADVLIALYTRASPQGLGFLHYNSEPMTAEQAVKLLEEAASYGKLYFDYCHGRVMKVDLSDDNGFCERLYDRDNGHGAAEGAIAPLRS